MIIKKMMLQMKGKKNFLYRKDERRREDCLLDGKARQKGKEL